MALLVAMTAAAQGESVHACAVLVPDKGHGDTARIQAALNACNPARAVVLQTRGNNATFESGPLILPRGVTLFLDRAVTLRASANPRDYDLQPGSCGSPLSGKAPNCKPFLFAYQAAYSAVMGEGIIEGQAMSGQKATAPELVSSYESQGFRIAGVTLRNAPGIPAAIYKTIGFEMSDVRIESPENSPGNAALLLSNAVNAKVAGVWIRAPGPAIVLKNSILGPTSGVQLRDIHVFGGRGIAVEEDEYGTPKDIRHDRICLHGTQAGVSPIQGDACPDESFPAAPKSAFTLDLATIARTGARTAITVHPGESVQKAVDSLPLTGGEISLQPGTYREVVTIRKPQVHLHGIDPDPAKTIIVFNHGSANSGGTFNSATFFVEADNVTLDHLSIVNDLGAGKGQAVALHVTGDRAIFRNLRIVGAQDTLFAASRFCYGDYGPCVTARQYFADCLIEGNIDYIFGDSKAVFENCELHAAPTGNVMYTAQSRHTPDQDSGYIFDRCRLTGDRRDGVISLGRSWRPYATVVLLNARIDAPVIPAGWTEWLRFGVPTLPTAYYAEYHSTGPGANPAAREKYAHQLTEAEAAKWSPRKFLAGEDGWSPMGTAPQAP